QAAGEFKDEITPYRVISRQPDLAGNTVRLRELLVEQDEGPRADTSAEGLARLRPVFRAGGSVTAGNSSQMSDGAGAVLLASEQAIKDYGLTPLARFVSFAVAGVRPEVMGIGPIAAIPQALRQAGLSQEQLDWIELNEAVAAQALAVIRDCGLDPAKGNPLGGAIALGHPPGATRPIRTATHRRHPHGDHRARPAPAQAEVRHGHHVHRHRHGRRRHHRSPLSLRCLTRTPGRPGVLASTRINADKAPDSFLIGPVRATPRQEVRPTGCRWGRGVPGR